MRLSKTEGIYKSVLTDKGFQNALLTYKDFSIKKRKGKTIVEFNEVTISPNKVDVRV